MKRAFFTLSLIVATAACGGSPAAPASSLSGSAVDFAGLWQGAVKYTQCTGMRHCFARIGSADQFTLRVQQSGARVRAVFTIFQYAVELGGDVLKDGTLELTGSSPFASETSHDFDLAIAVRRFSIKLAPGAGMIGTLVYDLRANQENSEYAESSPATLGGDIVNGSRSDLLVFASTVDGTWKGRFIVRTCQAIGPICEWYRVDEVGTVELRLTQNGSQVTGTARFLGEVPVTGQLSGQSLGIGGEILTPNSGGASQTRITAWNTSIDEFGRMSGTFDYLYAAPASAPKFGSSAHAELWQTVKVP